MDDLDLEAIDSTDLRSYLLNHVEITTISPVLFSIVLGQLEHMFDETGIIRIIP